MKNNDDQYWYIHIYTSEQDKAALNIYKLTHFVGTATYRPNNKKKTVDVSPTL